MMSYGKDDFRRALTTIFYAKWYVVVDVLCSFIGSLHPMLEFIEEWWDNIRYHTYVYLFRGEKDGFKSIVLFCKHGIPLQKSGVIWEIEPTPIYGCTDISYRYCSNRDTDIKEHKYAMKCISEKRGVYVVDLVRKKSGTCLKVKDRYGKRTFEYSLPH